MNNLFSKIKIISKWGMWGSAAFMVLGTFMAFHTNMHEIGKVREFFEVKKSCQKNR